VFPPIRGSPKIAMKLRHITTNIYNINYYHSIVIVIIRVIEYKSDFYYHQYFRCYH